MNLIQEELNKSREYGLEFLPEKEGFPPLVKLSLDNVARVEAMIQVDSKYCKAFDKTAGPIEGKYGGSTAFWMTRLKKYFDTHEIVNREDKEYIDIITKVVESVDRENSTHLNSDGGRRVIKKRILELEKNEILKPLKDRSFSLYELLAKKTGSKKRARTNPSFASKFCHYACMFLFEGQKEQDNFSIYDGILKK